MKKFAADKFNSSMPSLWRSFIYWQKSFAGKYQELNQGGYLQENGRSEMIWQTRSKYVLKVPLGDGKFVVYKSYRKISKPYKFYFRPSPCTAEALNYQLMMNCHLPTAELLAVGEERSFLHLRNAFIVTGFADGFRDGRDFARGGALSEQLAYRSEFILRNLALLAHCHDCGILHRGFTPANLLYKVREQADEKGHQLDIVWIDVASCRKQNRWRINKNAVVDFVQFFRFFDFSSDELAEYVQYYCQNRKNHPPTADKLLSKLQEKLPKRNKN